MKIASNILFVFFMLVTIAVASLESFRLGISYGEYRLRQQVIEALSKPQTIPTWRPKVDDFQLEEPKLQDLET